MDDQIGLRKIPFSLPLGKIDVVIVGVPNESPIGMEPSTIEILDGNFNPHLNPPGLGLCQTCRERENSNKQVNSVKIIDVAIGWPVCTRICRPPFRLVSPI